MQVFFLTEKMTVNNTMEGNETEHPVNILLSHHKSSQKTEREEKNKIK